MNFQSALEISRDVDKSLITLRLEANFSNVIE